MRCRAKLLFTVLESGGGVKEMTGKWKRKVKGEGERDEEGRGIEMGIGREAKKNRRGKAKLDGDGGTERGREGGRVGDGR